MSMLRTTFIPAVASICLTLVACKREVDGDRITEGGLLRVGDAGLDDAINLFYAALAKMDLVTTNGLLSRRILNLPLSEHYCPQGFVDFYGVDIWRPVHKKAVVFKWADAQVEGFWVTVECLKNDLIKVESNQGYSTRETGPSLVRSDLWLREGGDWKVIPQEASSNFAWVVLHDPGKLGAINREEDLVADVDDAKTVLQERKKHLEKLATLRKLAVEKTLQDIQAKHNLEKE